MKVREIDMLKEGTLLPPAPGKCQQCAVDHHPAEPHNQESMFYQMWFRKRHDRWPTWKDAMEHCPKHVKEVWIEELEKRGVEIEGPTKKAVRKDGGDDKQTVSD